MIAMLAAGQAASPAAAPATPRGAGPVGAPTTAPITVDGFVERFQRVEQVMRVDMAALNREVRDAIVLYRAEVATARVAGRAPRGCIPERGNGDLAFGKLVAAFRALPEAERAKPVREALFGYFDRQYPCPR